MARDNVTFADLVAIARRVGVKVIEAPSSHRGKLGKMGTVVGLTCHHTGTPNTYRPELDYPDFDVVKEGRPGLVNSLSAWGVGRHEAIYVFSEFLSWHAGTWLWKGITDGNGHFLGIEAAGIGDWTTFEREVYPRLVASALLFIDAGIDMAPRHLDGAMPRGRKSDAAALEGWFYDRVTFFMQNPNYININYGDPVAEEDEDMPIIVGTETKGIWMLSPIGYHWIGNTSTVVALQKAGAKEIGITDGEHANWLAAQQALRTQVTVDLDEKSLAAELRAAGLGGGASAQEMADVIAVRMTN